MIIIFCGIIIVVYLQLAKSRAKDQGMLVFFYTMVTPMLNPHIYISRSKKRQAVLKKLLEKVL